MHLLVLSKKDLRTIIEEFEDLGKEMRVIAHERKQYHEELIKKIIAEYKHKLNQENLE